MTTTHTEAHQKGAAIVAYLDGYEEAPEQKLPDERGHRGVLNQLQHLFLARHPSGPQFILSLRDGRFHVSGDWPKRGTRHMIPVDWGVQEYGDEPPRISVSATRHPERIAAEITRRFLPSFEPLYTQCLEKQAEWHRQKKAWEAQCRRLEALGAEPWGQGHEESQSYRIGDLYVSIQLGCESVYVERGSIPLDKLEGLIELLKERTHETTEEVTERVHRGGVGAGSRSGRRKRPGSGTSGSKGGGLVR